MLFRSGWPQRQPWQGQIEDLSLRGMRFRTRTDVSRGGVLMVECDILDALARVIAFERVADRAPRVVRVAFEGVAFRRRQGAFVVTRA